MKSPKEARAAWVEALRSGKYKQAHGVLNDRGKYCCLGVACELYIEDGGNLERVENGYGVAGRVGYRVPGDDDVDSMLPPDPVSEWLGITPGSATYGNDMRSLANDNDQGQTFAQIADTIEAEPSGLVVAS